MLKKRIIAGILNVKYTIIDSVKTFDDESDIVINVHPSKGQQHRCPICGKSLHFMTKVVVDVYGEPVIGTTKSFSWHLQLQELNARTMVY